MTENADTAAMADAIHKLYKNVSYGDRYSFDIWTTIVLITMVIFILIYLHVLNTVKSQKANWEANKCNPIYMPFAGLINSKDANYTSDNFNKCLDNINESITVDAKSSINGTFDVLTQMNGNMVSGLQGFTKFTGTLFDAMEQLVMSFMKRFALIIDENKYIYAEISNFFGTISGMLTDIYYTCLLLIDMIKLSISIMAMAFFGAVTIPSIVAFVGALIAVIIVLIITWGNMLAASPFALLAAIAMAFMILCLLLHAKFKDFGMNILKLTTNVR